MSEVKPMTPEEEKFYDGFEPKTIKVDPIGPTAELKVTIEQLQAQLAALELEREALRAALHGVIDEMAWAEFDPEDDDCWYGDSIKLLSQPPEYWAQKVKEEK